MDPRTHWNRPSTRSQDHTSSVSIWNCENDASHSWIVISRGMNKYVVEENFTQKQENLSTTKIWQPVLTQANPSRQNTREPNLVSKMFVQIDQRKWKDIVAVDFVSNRSLSWRVSKTMTKMLRNHGSHREDDRAIDGGTLLLTLCLDVKYENAGNWRQEKNSVLHESRRSHSLHACHPRSLWRC